MDSQETKPKIHTSVNLRGASTLVFPYVKKLLMVIRLLESEFLEFEQLQRENLFHTECNVFENIYSLIVDNDLLTQKAIYQ